MEPFTGQFCAPPPDPRQMIDGPLLVWHDTVAAAGDRLGLSVPADRAICRAPAAPAVTSNTGAGPIMAEIDLKERFPDMRPIRSAPGLFTLNGVGLTMAGARDHDQDTGTYVKTHALCVLFIPVIALGAYRVANSSEGGWYFLGKERLSVFAKVWNLALVFTIAAVIGVVSWKSYTGSSAYQSAHKVEQADALAAEGDLVAAAQLYQEVILDFPKSRNEALARFQAMLEGPAGQATATQVAEVLAIAVELVEHHQEMGGTLKPLPAALQLASQHEASDPAGALAILDAVEPLAEDPQSLIARRRTLLERIVQQDPGNVKLVGQLAVLLEADEDLARCKQLLAPLQDKLGATEGARVLGRIYASEGKLDESYALLEPYTRQRLEKYHQAEKALNAAYERVSNQAISDLKNDRAPKDFYRRYDRAGETQRQKMVDDYITEEVKNDHEIMTCRTALEQVSDVVPVALDLGLVMLRRGQQMSDPSARKSELEKAEKTFLAIQGAVGDTDSYRLMLGQVYYWLGRADEGRKLIDQLLEGNTGNIDLLIEVASTLRSVGEVPSARQIVEDAYSRTTRIEEKQQIATLRALMQKDLDDQITWLERCNPDRFETRASLAIARGRRFAEQGDEKQAIAKYREGIEIYESQLATASTLNNGALGYLALFSLTGSRDDHGKAVAMLERAVALEPSDSILLGNTADALLQQAIIDLAGDAFDVTALKSTPGVEGLGFLYDDEAGRDAARERFKQHAGVRKARDFYQRAMLLSPKSVGPLIGLHTIAVLQENTAALKDLSRRIDAVQPDVGSGIDATLEYLRGQEDGKYVRQLRTSARRLRELLGEGQVEPSSPTFALTATRLATALVGMATLGENVSPDEVVRLAEQAHAGAPSAGTRAALTDALLYRAGVQLARMDTQWADRLRATQRCLEPDFALAAAMAVDEQFASRALAHPDVKRAQLLILESRQKLPSRATPWQWAMLRRSHPDEAQRIVQQYLSDDAQAAERTVTVKLAPQSASAVYSLAWAHEMNGDKAVGDALLRDCAKLGIPLQMGEGQPSQ